MKIYLNPDLSDNQYVRLTEDNPLRMDVEFVNTNGLVGKLWNLLGLTDHPVSQQERAAYYHEALKKQVQQFPACALAQSFSKDPLGTSFACLAWRDTLLKTNWNSTVKNISARLDILAELESKPDKQWNGPIDRLDRLFADDIVWQILPQGMEIFLSCPRNYVFPKLYQLLNKLEKEGVTVHEPVLPEHKDNNLGKMTRYLMENIPCRLDEKDDSLEIWHFEQEKDALFYLADQAALHYGRQSDLFTAWIDTDNKKLENAFSLLNVPHSGSEMKQTIPHLAQVFVSALSLFKYPLNLIYLTDYLSCHFHPLGDAFAQKLLKEVRQQGGFYTARMFKNNPIQDTVRQFLNNPEQGELYMNLWLPQVQQQNEYVKKTDLKKVIGGLLSYTETYFKQDLGEIQRKQFEFLTHLLSSFKILVTNEQAEKDDAEVVIPFRMIQNWITNLYAPQNHLFTQAQVHAPYIVHAPGELPVTDKTVWSNFYDYKKNPSVFRFLTPVERRALEQRMDLWKKEEAYYRYLMYTPFLNTRNKLVLVVCDKKGEELVEPNPVYLRMNYAEWNGTHLPEKEDIHQLKDHFAACCIKEKELVREEDAVTLVDNYVSAKEGLRLEQKQLATFWPEKIKVTDLETLIQYPLDFVLNRIAHWHTENTPCLQTAYNSVFHLLVKQFIQPDTAWKTIRTNIREKFEEVFEACVRYRGLILFLPEYEMERKKYKEQSKQALMKCVDVLEKRQCTIRLSGEKPSAENLLGDGVILWADETDLLLEENAQAWAGQIMVWSEHPEHYYRKPVLLEAYRKIIQKQHETVSPFVYYVAPDGVIVSVDNDFLRDPLSPTNEVDVFARIDASYQYRKAEFLEGRVENAEGVILETIPYYIQQANQNLYPLNARKANKEEMRTDGHLRKKENPNRVYNSFKQELL